MTAAVPNDAPKPRLCHVRKWEDFNGYGFNLHAEKGKHGHHIGAVDKGSPAEAAGLQEGDRIVEVNGTNIANENHQQVVSRIRAVANEVKLMVVDTPTDEYYRERKIVVRGDMAGVVHITTPPTKAEFEADPKAGYAAAAPVNTTDDSEPQPRLAKLRTWPDFQGYGFNLTTEKSKPGQYIGKVDADSPASTAGVREGDKIVEVNGVNVTAETHHQVVTRIKSRAGQVDLLLVDKDAEAYYAKKGSVIRGDMPNVHIQETPETGKAPRPRLFHLRKWPDFSGYGFDLHEEKTRPGHLIGSVDAGSPAATVGMRRDDKIIEVNGHNVLEESHKRVVERIREAPDEVKLLVVDNVAEQYYNDNSIWVHGRMDNIDLIECSSENPAGTVVSSSEVTVNAVNHTDNTSSHEASMNDTASSHGEDKTSSHGEDKTISVKYAPRLCYMELSPDFPGYGFDLQNEKGREGHLIGDVEAGSPANRSGIREGDRVIEVNKENVENVPHSDVVEKIKAANGKLNLLVVDDDAYHYYLNNGIKVQEDLIQKTEEVQINGAISADTSEQPLETETTLLVGDSRARICHLQSTPAFQGYGFELQRLKKSKGHFIGPVDPGSPAEVAGLHQGDEIIEIQDVNVEKKSHNEVVHILLAHREKVVLLVTDSGLNDTPAVSIPSMTATAVPSRLPDPHARHCYLKKWPDFDGYGFDLYEIKKKPGPRIGVIAKDSPAEATGLKQDDYIIEVDGVNVEKVKHRDMIKKIGSTSKVRMLLVDEQARKHFKKQSVRIHSGMEHVESIYCPDDRNVVAVSSGPRQVQLKTSPDYTGFGFDLQELKAKPGHFIGEVDKGSPAEAAGLETGDQIVEINGSPILNDSHDEVVRKVQENSGEVNLMVVSAGSSTVYHSNALWVNTGNRDTVIMVPSDQVDLTEPEQTHAVAMATTTSSSTDPVDISGTVISPTAPRPRLCKLQRWADFAGYGFDLHEEKSHPGHIIGAVQAGSPAEEAGMKINDNVVEVNGHNVLESTHQEVVSHIKQYEDHVDMLVLDNDAKDYYEDNEIWVHGKMSNIQVIECPRRSSQAEEIPIPIPVSNTLEATPVETTESEPVLRLCVLKKWSDFSGYGFNLHDEKGIAGHFIGTVDDGSPAEAAGLKAKDKVIEVNGQSVFEDDHHGVVQKITSNPDGVQMLVMDAEGDEYYRTHNIKPHGGMANITIINCPSEKPSIVEAVTTVETSSVELPTVEDHQEAAVVAVTTTETHISHPPGSLRLCTLKKTADYDGYGFNLHDQVGRPGHFIGGVEPGSPAEAAGVKIEDQLYEVNGVSVRSVDHNEVIQHVIENPAQVQMLVGHPDVGQYYVDQGTWPHSQLPDVMVTESRVSRAQANGVLEAKVDEIVVAEYDGHAYVAPEREPTKQPSPVLVRAPTPERPPTPEPVRVPTPEPVRVPTPEPVRAPTPEPVRVPTPEPVPTPIVEVARVPTPEPIREPSPPPQVNEVIETVAVTRVVSEVRHEAEIKPVVEEAIKQEAEKAEVEVHDLKMNADSNVVVVPASFGENTDVNLQGGSHVEVSQVVTSEEHALDLESGSRNITVVNIQEAEPSVVISQPVLRESRPVDTSRLSYSKVEVVDVSPEVAVAPTYAHIEVPSTTVERSTDIVIQENTETVRAMSTTAGNTVVTALPDRSIETVHVVKTEEKVATIPAYTEGINIGSVSMVDANATESMMHGHTTDVNVVSTTNTFVSAVPQVETKTVETVHIERADGLAVDSSKVIVPAVITENRAVSLQGDTHVEVSKVVTTEEHVLESEGGERNISIVNVQEAEPSVVISQPVLTQSRPVDITPFSDSKVEVTEVSREVNVTPGYAHVVVPPPTEVKSTEVVIQKNTEVSREVNVTPGYAHVVVPPPTEVKNTEVVIQKNNEAVRAMSTTAEKTVATSLPDTSIETVHVMKTEEKVATIPAYTGGINIGSVSMVDGTAVSTTRENTVVTTLPDTSIETVHVVKTEEKVATIPAETAGINIGSLSMVDGSAVSTTTESTVVTALPVTTVDTVHVVKTEEKVATIPTYTEGINIGSASMVDGTAMSTTTENTVVTTLPDTSIETVRVVKTEEKVATMPAYTEGINVGSVSMVDANATESMKQGHTTDINVVSTTTTFVSTETQMETKAEETVHIERGGLVVTPPVVESQPSLTVAKGDTDIVMHDYRSQMIETSLIGSASIHEVKSSEMVQSDGLDSVEMTKEIDTNGILIVPPPPPLPEEMSGSHVEVTKETEVTYVESSMSQDDIGESVTAGTVVVGAVAVAADSISVSSAATSEASSAAAGGYDFEEPVGTTDLTYHVDPVSFDASLNGVQQVEVSTEHVEEPVYQNIEREINQADFTSVVTVSSEHVETSSEPVHISSETVSVQESVSIPEPVIVAAPESTAQSVTESVHTEHISSSGHSDSAEITTVVTTTTTEIVSNTSLERRDSSHSGVAAELELAAPPPTEFTDVQNGASRRSSASTISDSVTQYAFGEATEDLNESVEVSEFMSSTTEPVVIKTTYTSSSYSYQKPAAPPAPQQNSGDPLGGTSLQDVLSRVKSRKKPKAGTGNLSMKEKFELFQQL